MSSDCRSERSMDWWMRARVTLGAACVVLGIAVSTVAPVRGAALEPGLHEVRADVLNVRLAPRPDARILRQLRDRERVEVLQLVGRWARLTEYYEGSSVGTPGMVAEWVSAEFLFRPGAPVTAAPVPSPGPRKIAGTASDTPLAAGSPARGTPADVRSAIVRSDDYDRHRDAFNEAAERLLADGTCTVDDFARTSGWLRAGNEQPVTYFVVCVAGAGRKSVFLDPATGTVFH